MTPQETIELDQALETVAAILFKNTPPEQLQDFESIESSVRDHLLEQVGPRVGNFFKQCHGNNSGTQTPGSKLPREAQS